MTEVDDRLAALRERANRPVRIDGPAPLAGNVRVQGAKNSALKLIPAALAFDGVARIRNVPQIIDTLELLHIAETLGAVVTFDDDDDAVVVDTRPVRPVPIPYAVTKRTTASFSFAGALLGRFGRVRIGRPGGDEIGLRPVDLHVDAFRSMGAEVHDDAELIEARLDPGRLPRDPSVDLPFPSAGATVNAVLLLAASGRAGRVGNVPLDGDTRAFVEGVAALGYPLEFRGRDVVGGARTPSRRPEGAVDLTCPPDRNDAMTWLAAGGLSTGGVTVHGVDVGDLASGLDVFAALGVDVVRAGERALTVRRGPAARTPDGHTVVAGASPGFHSDWAPFVQVLFALGRGTGRTVDTLYTDRVRQAEVLEQLGASVSIGGGPVDGVDVHFRTPVADARHVVSVRGGARLRGTDVRVGYDVRACAAVLLACTQAYGSSRVAEVYALYRGYDGFLDRLAALGGAVSLAGDRPDGDVAGVPARRSASTPPSFP